MHPIADHIHTLSTRVWRESGKYEARVYGTEREDGTWEGWIEFHPVDAYGSVLRTGQETTQPSRETLDYWAGGLEPVYLQGAMTRAIDLQAALTRRRK